MEDMIEQANEIQESLSRTYGVPEEVDEADLQAGAWRSSTLPPLNRLTPCTELDALGDDLAMEGESDMPSYLKDTTSQLPDFIDEAPEASSVPQEPVKAV